MTLTRSQAKRRAKVDWGTADLTRTSAVQVLFPETCWIKSFAQAGKKRLDAGKVRAAVRNLRTNPELRDAERVQETDELPAFKSRARHVGRDDRNTYPGER
jgi:hypothetical protein